MNTRTMAVYERPGATSAARPQMHTPAETLDTASREYREQVEELNMSDGAPQTVSDANDSLRQKHSEFITWLAQQLDKELAERMKEELLQPRGIGRGELKDQLTDNLKVVQRLDSAGVIEINNYKAVVQFFERQKEQRTVNEIRKKLQELKLAEESTH